MLHTKARWLLCLAVLAIGALAVSGCGGGSDSSDGSSATESASAGVEGDSEAGSKGIEEAKKSVEEGLKAPTKISVTEPLSQKPTPGKTVAFMNCDLPICNEFEIGLKEATKALHWQLKSIHTGSTPESVQSAWSEAVQLDPDGVVMSGTPSQLFSSQLQEYSEEGGVFVTSAVEEPAGGPVAAVASGPEYFDEQGQWLARWVVAEREEGANALFINVSDFPVLQGMLGSFKKEYNHLCPSCELEVLTVPAAAIGKSLPSEVVSFVQKNPDTNYIVPSFGDAVVGLPQALAAAGLGEDIGILSQGGSPVNLEYIVNGEQTAEVPQPLQMIGWVWVDALARVFAGDEPPEAEYQKMPRQYLTDENIVNPTEPWPSVPGFQQQFERLWHVR